MPVDPAITRTILEQELVAVRDLGRTHKWGIIPNFPELRVTVTMYAYNGDLFIVEAQCDDYKELPAFFEFIDPITGTCGTKGAYPRGHDSFFHQAPCLCAPIERHTRTSIPLAPTVTGRLVIGPTQLPTAQHGRTTPLSPTYSA
jgi:hypothetical protein